MSGDPISVPELPDPMPEAVEWWDATRTRQLMIQRCVACGHHQLYPRVICTACHGRRLELVRASGRGTVYSHTTVHRAPGPGFTPPYVVAIVELAEGPRLLTNITAAGVRCEDPVEVDWKPLPDGRNLPIFRPAQVVAAGA